MALVRRTRSTRQKRKRVFIEKQARSAECLLTIHEETADEDPIALGKKHCLARVHSCLIVTGTLERNWIIKPCPHGCDLNTLHLKIR